MSILSKVTTFLQETKTETRRVNWPTRQETVRNTVIVIFFSVAVAAFLGAFDFLFTLALERFLS